MMAVEEVGAVFEAQVQGLASDGRGVVVHPSGRRFFVAGVCEGETVTLRITQLKGSIGFGVCIEMLRPSEQRIPPFCEHHGFSTGKCGGCPWQFMAYQEQLERKQARVEREFQRVDSSIQIEKIWPSEKTKHYRNRAQLKSDGKRIGYLSAASNDLAPIQDCPILSDKNRQTLSDLIAQLPNSAWQPEQKLLRQKKWTTLDIDEDIEAGEVSINQRRPFRQANSEQNSNIKRWLHGKLAGLDKDQKVVELFCGSGNLTEVIAEQGFADIVAAEGVQSALTILQAKQLPGVQTRLANLFIADELASLFTKKSAPDILVLDPPRDGLKERQALIRKKSPLKDVFYVSCDLATLTRDVAFFLENNFRIKEVQPLDQFPHTPHIELLVHLSSRKR